MQNVFICKANKYFHIKYIKYKKIYKIYKIYLYNKIY